MTTTIVTELTYLPLTPEQLEIFKSCNPERIRQLACEGDGLKNRDLRNVNFARIPYINDLRRDPESKRLISRCPLVGGKFSRANLAGVSLPRGSVFMNADFSGANLCGLHGDSNTDEEYDNCDFYFYRAIFDDADLSDVDITFSSFDEARFKRTVLRGSRLRYCGFLGGVLSEIDASDTGIDLEGSKFNNAQLHRIKLGGARLNRCNFQNTQMEDVDLTRALVTNAQFDSAQLTDVKFIGINLEKDGTPSLHQRSSFNAARLLCCDFTEAHMGESFFERAVLEETRFVRAVLGGCHFVGARFNKCDVTDADFTNAIFTGEIVPGEKEPVVFNDTDTRLAIVKEGPKRDRKKSLHEFLSAAAAPLSPQVPITSPSATGLKRAR